MSPEPAGNGVHGPSAITWSQASRTDSGLSGRPWNPSFTATATRPMYPAPTEKHSPVAVQSSCTSHTASAATWSTDIHSCNRGDAGIGPNPPGRVFADGAMTFTVIPSGAPSSASARVRPTTPIFDVAYDAIPATPHRPAPDDTLRIRPPPWAAIAAHAGRVTLR